MGFFLPTAAAGNGLSLATFGRSGEIMGFFYPRIDFAQNVREGMPAVQLSDGFHWCFADCFRTEQAFVPGGNVLITRLQHHSRPLTIEITDVVPPGEQALVRRIAITRDASVGDVRFLHYFRLAVGDSDLRNGIHAYPAKNLVIQYYRNVALALHAGAPFAVRCGSLHQDQASADGATKQGMIAGDFGGGFEQSIGRVDFAIAFKPVTGISWETVMVLAGAPSREGAAACAARLAREDFAGLTASANHRARVILDAAGDCPVPALKPAFERAVIALHDLYDQNEGTLIAAPEFDPAYQLSGGYGYCWPRDAAVSCLALQRIGATDMARRFFDWAARTQLEDGHWYQRSWTDGSPASAWCVRDGEIQLDQTCAILHAAGVFARRLREAGEPERADHFVERWLPTARRAVLAILAHIGPDHLHRTAMDLWENSTGSFTYTQAAVIASLREAEEVFGIEPKATGGAVRKALGDALLRTFWRKEENCWLRRIAPDGHPDPTLDSSAMGLIDPWETLNLHDAEDRRLAGLTLDGISDRLRSEVKGGGAILRFQAESYMGGGPGCVNTLWLAVCRLRMALTAEASPERARHRERAVADLGIAIANANPTGQLPELIPKMAGVSDYWAAPHAWASSLLIEAVILLRELATIEATPFDSARAQAKRRAPAH